MKSKKPSVTISLYEVWWPLQQCTVWFGCIQTDLHKPYSACSSVSTISQNGFWNPLLHLKKTNVPITSMTPCVQSWPNALTPSLESNINKEHVDEDWWWTSSLKKVTTICTILLIAEVSTLTHQWLKHSPWNINIEQVDADGWRTSSHKKVITICTFLLIAEVWHTNDSSTPHGT